MNAVNFLYFFYFLYYKKRYDGLPRDTIPYMFTYGIMMGTHPHATPAAGFSKRKIFDTYWKVAVVS